MAIDGPWAVNELQEFIGLAETSASEAWLVARAPVVEQILDRVTPDWRAPVPLSGAYTRWDRYREAAQRAMVLLQREAELQEMLGCNAPTLDAGRFHPWAWEGARSLWQSHHYREAVEAALKKVNAETQNKTGRHDISETNLFKQLFSLDDPKPGIPRLRLKDDDGSDTYRSVHRGTMALAEGLFAGIRNIVSHTVAETEADEQAALEQLAAVSVLARWVDDARVETSP